MELFFVFYQPLFTGTSGTLALAGPPVNNYFLLVFAFILFFGGLKSVATKCVVPTELFNLFQLLVCLFDEGEIALVAHFCCSRYVISPSSK